jgi:anti-anti-sigma factor
VTSTPAVSVARLDTALLARPQGKILDEAAVRALTAAVDEACAEDTTFTAVIVDMSQVAVLPSFALGLLVKLSDHCVGRSQKLTFAALQPQVRRMFAVTRLDWVFQVAPTVEAAARQ